VEPQTVSKSASIFVAVGNTYQNESALPALTGTTPHVDRRRVPSSERKRVMMSRPDH
jgi:hypothetical protein